MLFLVNQSGNIFIKVSASSAISQIPDRHYLSGSNIIKDIDELEYLIVIGIHVNPEGVGGIDVTVIIEEKERNGDEELDIFLARAESELREKYPKP